MSEAALDIAACVIGACAALIGLIALAEEHRGSPMCQRFVVGLMVVLCINVALDGYAAAQLDGRLANPVGVAFCFCLALTWAFRLRALRRSRGGFHIRIRREQ